MNGGAKVKTTTGRVILSEILPEELGFDRDQQGDGQKELKNLIATATAAGTKATVMLADRLKDLGYKFATKAGFHLGQGHGDPSPQEGSSGQGQAEVRNDRGPVQRRSHHRR
jgi:DNA-directed RNA polymerase beta' subunit